VARFVEGTLGIELRTRWASRDRQPAVSYAFAELGAALSRARASETANLLAGGEFQVLLRTCAAAGRYQSESRPTSPPSRRWPASRSPTPSGWRPRAQGSSTRSCFPSEQE
jgi:hypothetical protein